MRLPPCIYRQNMKVMQPNTPKGSTDGAFTAAFSSHVHTYKAKISKNMIEIAAQFLPQMQIPSYRLTPDQNATITQNPHSGGVIVQLKPHNTTQMPAQNTTIPAVPTNAVIKTPARSRKRQFLQHTLFGCV